MHGPTFSFPGQLSKLMQRFKSCSASIIPWLVYPRSVLFARGNECSRSASKWDKLLCQLKHLGQLYWGVLHILRMQNGRCLIRQLLPRINVRHLVPMDQQLKQVIVTECYIGQVKSQVHIAD